MHPCARSNTALGEESFAAISLILKVPSRSIFIVDICTIPVVFYFWGASNSSMHSGPGLWCDGTRSYSGNSSSGVLGCWRVGALRKFHDVSWMPFSARLNKNSVFTRHLLKLFLLKPQLFFRMLDWQAWVLCEKVMPNADESDRNDINLVRCITKNFLSTAGLAFPQEG